MCRGARLRSFRPGKSPPAPPHRPAFAPGGRLEARRHPPGTVRPVLKSTTSNQVRPDAEPIDRARDDPAIGQGRGDRSFGQRILTEQAGKRRIADQRAGRVRNFAGEPIPAPLPPAPANARPGMSDRPARHPEVVRIANAAASRAAPPRASRDLAGRRHPGPRQSATAPMDAAVELRLALAGATIRAPATDRADACPNRSARLLVPLLSHTKAGPQPSTSTAAAPSRSIARADCRCQLPSGTSRFGFAPAMTSRSAARVRPT